MSYIASILLCTLYEQASCTFAEELTAATQEIKCVFGLPFTACVTEVTNIGYIFAQFMSQLNLNVSVD